MSIPQVFNLFIASFVILFFLFNFGTEKGWIRWE